MAMSWLNLEFSLRGRYSDNNEKAKQLLLQKLISRLVEKSADVPHPLPQRNEHEEALGVLSSFSEPLAPWVLSKKEDPLPSHMVFITTPH